MNSIKEKNKLKIGDWVRDAIKGDVVIRIDSENIQNIEFQYSRYRKIKNVLLILMLNYQYKNRIG